jgi:hypothetical protein
MRKLTPKILITSLLLSLIILPTLSHAEDTSQVKAAKQKYNHYDSRVLWKYTDAEKQAPLKKSKKDNAKKIERLVEGIVMRAAPGGDDEPGGGGGGGGGGTGGSGNSGSLAYQEVLAKLDVQMGVTPETSDLLGEQIDLNTGSVSFRHTDISIPGNNNLEVAIHRVFKGANYAHSSTLEMADWMLDIPYIHTTLLKGSTRYSGDWGQGRECSGNLNPGSITNSGFIFNSFEYWNGDTLNVPGRVNEKLLRNSGGITSSAHPKVTKSNWRISCADNASSFGEKFIAQAPNGDTYTFSELRLVGTKPIVKNYKGVSRYHAFMMVSQIKDTHGNTVNYQYSNGQLTKISSLDSSGLSDGRVITINYSNNRVSSITSGNRIWSYAYSGNSLVSVTRPDNLFWQYSLDSLGTVQAGSTSDSNSEICSYPSNVSSYSSGTIKHPNGTLGTFKLQAKRFGRSRVTRRFNAAEQTDYTMRCFGVMSLVKKTLTGEELSNMVWNYDYSQKEGFWNGYAASSIHKFTGTVPPYINNYDYKKTSVVSPDGSKTIYYHNRNFQSVLDGKLVVTEYYDTDGTTLLKRIRNTYSQSAYLGGSEQFNENNISHNYVARKTSRIEEMFNSGGKDTYKSNYSNFNKFHAPQTIVEYGNTGSRSKS